MNPLKEQFLQTKQEAEERRKDGKQRTLQKKLEKYILANSMMQDVSDIPEYYRAVAIPGRSPNLSLSCFLDSRFKKTGVWKTFLETVREFGNAVIIFRTKQFGKAKAAWWCLTNMDTDMEQGKGRLIIPVKGERSIYILNFTQFLKEMEL